MFKNLKKKMAKVALIAIALQLVVFGLGGGATGAYAAVEPDLVDPSLVSISYGGQVALGTADSNTFVLDVSKADGVDLQAATVVIDEDVTIDVIGSGSLLLDDYIYSTITPEINVADLLGFSPVTLVDLQSYGDVITLELTLTDADAPDNMSTYEVIVMTKDSTDPILTAVSYNETAATMSGNVWAFDTNGLTDSDLAAMEIVMTASEAGTLTFTDYGTSETLVEGDNTFALSTLVGSDVTNALLQSIAVEGSVTINAEFEDDSTNATSYQFLFSLDTTKVVVTMTSKPVIVNNVEEAIEVTFVGDESISLSSATIEFVQGTVTYSAPALDVVAKDAKTLIVTIPADTFAKGTEAIAVTADFADVAGNVTNFVGSIEVDTVAPAAVTGLTLLLDKNTGNVTLAWVNPTAGTYESIIIKRIGNDGSIAKFVTSGPTVIGYVDDTTQRGVTYDYIVLVVDAAGNSTATAPASILVPNIVVAVATTVTTTTGTVDFEESDSSNEVAVTAEVDEDVAAATDITDTEEDGLPIWGIILLIFIAAVGAYLIWSQKPAPQAERIFIEEKKNTKTKPEKPVNDNAPKKKSNPNNKNTNKKK